MFRKNLRLAFRSFARNKATVAIHMLGLAVGISASLVIFLIVRYDFSFDRWEPDGDRIYRVYTKVGTENTNKGINVLAPKAISQSVSGIEILAHFCGSPNLSYARVSDGAKVLNHWGTMVFADQQFFKIIPYQWLAGQPSVLDSINTIVLSKSEVGRFFPGLNDQDAVGRVITFDDSISLTVAGVVADLTRNSDFDYKNFVSLRTFNETPLKDRYGTRSWGSVTDRSQCLIKLMPGIDRAHVERQIQDLYTSQTKDSDQSWRQSGGLQPLHDIHFNQELGGTVNKSSLVNLAVLALLLLLLAAINFINLSTAASSLKAKEIGVRKTFGGSNRSVVCQFLTETFALTLMATLLAVVLVPFLLHVFEGFVPDGLSADSLFSPVVGLFLIAVTLLVTLLAGLYPALVLTRFKPAVALKAQPLRRGKSGGALLRQGLTVAQFVIAQVFLIVVVVIGKQISFAMNRDLGFRKDAIVSFYIPDGFNAGVNSHKHVLAAKIRQLKGVEQLSISTGPPTRGGYNTTSVFAMKGGKKIELNNVHDRSVDQDYMALFDLKLIAGRNLVVQQNSSIGQVLVNESLMHALGETNPGAVVGTYLYDGYTDTSVIVGVLSDFTTQSLHHSIQPTVLFADLDQDGYIMSILLDRNHPQYWKSTIAEMGKQFKSFYPNVDFDYSFYDETLANLYSADRRLSKLLTWATGLAIFISCLGLLGLVSFMAHQKTKEIGIRKVLGATVAGIIALLSQQLVRLVLLASVIAFPIAWYFSNRWLGNFAVRTSVGYLVFVLCALGMLLLAFAVLWIRTYGAARANPVDSLRDE